MTTEAIRLDSLVKRIRDYAPRSTNYTLFIEAADAIEMLRSALADARASFLGLQPDFGGPVAAQMGKAIARINAVLTHNAANERQGKQNGTDV